MPISNIATVTDEISAAMSLRSLQHRVLASNLANRDTQGYQRLQMQFDRALAQARVVAAAPDAADHASLDQELVALFTNAGEYQAMARVLNRYFAILSTITSQTRV